MGSAPRFSALGFRILLDISQRQNSAPTFWDLSIEISARPQPPADICTDAAISFCRFLLVGDLLGMLPAPQNSARAKLGSARAYRILKARVSGKNGISFQESETPQIPIGAPDFCLSRAERVWDVICAIWDLLRCAEICKSGVIEFLEVEKSLEQIFPLELLLPSFSPLSARLLLGSEICCLRVDWDERGAWFVGCSWHTVPSWSAAHEV